MTTSDILLAWRRILQGSQPLLSIEITKECPLHCPGCYAYQPEHLGGLVELRQLSDFQGAALVERVLDLVSRLRPIHVSIVGGEPLVRYRELDRILPELDRMGIETMVVTSAVRPIPSGWARLERLHLAVSIDGLQPEHDLRRSPATYERILKHIEGQSVIVHCTITRQMLAAPDAIHEFSRFWSARGAVKNIWFSLYTPQQGEESPERLRREDRRSAVAAIRSARSRYPKIAVADEALAGFLDPPQSPSECIFAQLTTCLSADLETPVTPCQLGGHPDCTQCGCLASLGLDAIGKHRLAGLVPVSSVLALSTAIGRRLNRTPTLQRTA